VSAAAQYEELEAHLPEDWTDARFVLKLDDAAQAERAAALLIPFAPGRIGNEVRFSVPRHGGKRDQARQLLSRIDREGIRGTLDLVTAATSAPGQAEEPRAAWTSAAAAWDAEVAPLPGDWTDVYAQVELASSDFLDRAALLLAPLNPARFDDSAAFRFRVARTYGYGASPEMTRRCLERLDEDGIGARATILHALSDTKPVVTQGPVWYVDGRAV
jgi:hypothetical protein